MNSNRKIKIGPMVGALALAVATPAALAMANDDVGIAADGGTADDGGTALPDSAGGVICFEVDNGFFSNGPIEGIPVGGDWFDVEVSAFEGDWADEFDGELPPLPEELVELLNQEAADLAAHLDAAGIAHEMVDGPMGEKWVEWDFEDEAANAAVEEFFEGRDSFTDFDVFEDEFLFDDELMELPEELVELLNQEAADLAAHLDAAGIAHEMVDGPMGEKWVEWDFEDEAANAAVEEFFEGREDPFDTVFEVDMFFDDMGIEFGDFADEFDFGPAVICVEAPTAQAERFADEMAGLSEALTDAGITYTTESVEVEVPVWDFEDEDAREVVEQYYSDLHEEELDGFEDFHWEQQEDSEDS